MVSLVQSGKYGAINITGTSKIWYYVIKFVSEAYILNYETTYNRQIISSGKIVVKVQYLRCMQENTNCYQEHKNQQQVIIFPTQTIVHPCLDIVSVIYVHDIPKIIFNINHAK